MVKMVGQNYIDRYANSLDREYYLDDRYFLPTLETTYHINAPEYAASEEESINIEASEIGTTTNPFAPVLQAFQEKLRAGARKLEIGFFGAGKGSQNRYTPESFGKDERRALKELAKLNEIKVSTHATVAVQGLAGFENGEFKDEKREMALKEIAKAIDFAAEATTGGAVVVHTGEFVRPIELVKDKLKGEEVEFSNWLSEGKVRQFYFVDKKTGKMIAVSRDTELQIPYSPEEKEDEFLRELLKKNGNGRRVIKFEELLEAYKEKYKDRIKGKREDEIALEVVKEFFWKKEAEAKKVERNRYEIELKKTEDEIQVLDRINSIVKRNKGVLVETFERIKEAIKNNNEIYEEDKRRLINNLDLLKSQMSSYRLFESILNTNGSEESIKEVVKNLILRDFATYANELRIRSNFEKVFNSVQKVVDEEINKKLQIGGSFEIDPMVRYHIHLSSQGVRSEKDYEIFMMKYMRTKEEEKKNYERALEVAKAEEESVKEKIEATDIVERYALEKTAETLARAGYLAYEKYKKHKDELEEPIFIAPENVFVEEYGSHPEELIKIVEKSREVLKNFLVKQRNFDPKEAEKIAKTHIKATLDIGHLNMWRQYFKAKPGETPEETERRFVEWVKEKTKEMVKKGIIGHVHLSDNFGFGDEHLSVGQGNAPIREFMKIIEEAGIKSIIVEPSGLNPQRVMTDAWSYLNAPIGGTVRRIRFAELQHAHYGLARPPLNIVGSYVPSNEWRLWSKTPLE